MWQGHPLRCADSVLLPERFVVAYVQEELNTAPAFTFGTHVSGLLRSAIGVQSRPIGAPESVTSSVASGRTTSLWLDLPPFPARFM